MEEKKKMLKLSKDDFKDTKVTVASLTVIVVQSIIIIFGLYYRWDWIAYECAAMLIVPAVIILWYGVKAIIDADKLMAEENRRDE